MSNSDAMQKASAKALERSDKPFATQGDEASSSKKAIRKSASTTPRNKQDERLSEYEANTPPTPS